VVRLAQGQTPQIAQMELVTTDLLSSR
jgi:hypothetical protein